MSHSHDHSHSHSHSHGHSHGDQQPDYVEQNRAHHEGEDAVNFQINSPLNAWASQQIYEMILESYEFSDESTVLDLACGAGVVTLKLLENAAKVVGVDLSNALTASFNKRVKDRGVDPKTAYAVQKDALLDEATELDGELFDVVVCSQAYHHIPDVQAVTNALSRRVKPGGVLIVIDNASTSGFDRWKNELGHSEDRKKVDHVVAHKSGFTDQELTKLFDTTGRFSEVVVKPGRKTTFKKMIELGGPNNWVKAMNPPPELEFEWIVAVGRRNNVDGP